MKKLEADTPALVAKAAFLAIGKEFIQPLSTKEELIAALHQAGKNPTKSFVDKYWTQRTLLVSLNDFTRIIKDTCESVKDQRARLHRAFLRFDANKDGSISYKELRTLLLSKGDRLDESEIAQIFQDSDLNKDGKIDYAEFVRMVERTAEDTVEQNLRRLEEYERSMRASKKADRLERTRQHQDGIASSQSSSTDSERKHSEASSQSKGSNTEVSMSTDAVVRVADGRIIMPKTSSKSTAFPTAPERETLKSAKLKGCFFYEETEEGKELVIIGHRYLLKVDGPGQVVCRISYQHYGDIPTEFNSDLLLFVVDNEYNTVEAVTSSYDKKGPIFYCNFTTTEPTSSYTLIPVTSACRFRPSKYRAERVQSNPDVKRKPLLEPKEGRFVLIKHFRMVLMTVFDLFDLNNSGTLDRDEFNLFNVRTGDEAVSDEEWHVLKNSFGGDDKSIGEISLKGFLQLHQIEADDSKGDTEDMWVSLAQAGYNHNLVLDEACPFEIQCYSCDCSSLSLQVTEILPLTHGVEWQLIVEYLWSQAQPLMNTDTFATKYWAAPFVLILLCKNMSSEINSFTIRTNGSKNVVQNSLVDFDGFSLDISNPKLLLFAVAETTGSEWVLNFEQDSTS